MSNFFYSKLAITNIKNNKKLLLPYLISSIFMLAMLYIMISLRTNEEITSLTLHQVLQFGTVVIIIFIGIFLIYTYSFFIKKRIKELGLYSVLGMTKKHISKIISIELTIIYMLNIILGIFVGIILDKLAYLFLVKLISTEIKFGFHISILAIILTSIVFSIIYIIIFFITLFKIYRLNIINLLKEDKVGEKEPKSRIILTILGVALIGYGYYTALSIKTPLEAISNFFYAVIAVIIGTYLLFIAISIFVLKTLKNNKKFYYKTKNFITISSLLYRMKRNAVGLASICILSTMILVTIGSTSSLYSGIENSLEQTFPREVVSNIYRGKDDTTNEYINDVKKIANKNNETIENEIEYNAIIATGTKVAGGINIIDKPFELNSGYSNSASVIVLELEEYNKMNKTNFSLEEDEILFKDLRNKLGKTNFSVQGITYKIKKEIDNIENIGFQIANITDTYYVVVKNKDIQQEIKSNMEKSLDKDYDLMTRYVAFDITNKNNGESKIKENLKQYNEYIEEQGKDSFINTEFKTEARKEFHGMYGGLLFIGIFISIVFLITAVMIMYYKQITEGYDDKDRFYTMQKVGLRQSEIKQTIKSQVLMIFFAPLIVAIIHIVVAYPFIEKVLKLLLLSNTKIFMISMLITSVVFAIFYFIVYKGTSKIYYSIIKE